MNRQRPYVIGLTGNIACGKSLVRKTLRDLGAETYDADHVAHEVMRHGTPAWHEIVARFGDGVVGDDGEINRRALGAIVFADPAALEALDAIVHPATVAAIREQVERLSGGVAVIDAIKLFEAGLSEDCDEIWVVDCTREQQIERLMQRNNLTREMAIERIDAQPPQSEKRARADRVIDNSSAPDAAVAAVHALWNAMRDRMQNRH